MFLLLFGLPVLYTVFRFLRTEMLGADGKLWAQFIISQDINGP